MKKQQLLFAPLAFVVMLLSNPLTVLAAEDESPTPEMQNLINSEEYQQAYDLGTANLEEWEGDPQFDYFFGLAALEIGNANEAVFALERTASTSSNVRLRSRAQLDLARAYFVTNNLTASENLFLLVLETNPPVNVQQNIQVFLQLIGSRRDAQSPTFNWSISSVIGSDSNANSATSNGLIDTP
tara:strand:+ start:11915 stop:12466 length:552 start_codon:yes stop_codon:yes gene_type:complete